MDYLVIAVMSLVGAWLGSFLGAYLKKKGENLATHEDIDKLVGQMKAVTQATKEIESRILGDAWDRQKRWELKRDVLFETTQKIAALKNAMTYFYAVYQTEKISAQKGLPERLQEKIDAGKAWGDAFNGLEAAILQVELICSGEMKKALMALAIFVGNLMKRIRDGNPEAFQSSLNEYTEKLDAVSRAMKNEIAGLASITLQSNESSAAPIPGPPSPKATS